MSRLRVRIPGRSPRPADNGRPILAVDIDGVVSLFGFDEAPTGVGVEFQVIEGRMHCISVAAGYLLQNLSEQYEMVWATGWEEGAQRMSQLLGLPKWPHLTFAGAARFGSADWKLAPLEKYARGRSLAWVDDSFDDGCYQWAQQRQEPTLLVATESEVGLVEVQAEALRGWARSLEAEAPGQPAGPR